MPGTVIVGIPAAVRVPATRIRAAPSGLRVPGARAVGVDIVVTVSVAQTGILGAALASGTGPGGRRAFVPYVAVIRGRAEAVIERDVAVVALDVAGAGLIGPDGRIAGHRCGAVQKTVRVRRLVVVVRGRVRRMVVVVAGAAGFSPGRAAVDVVVAETAVLSIGGTAISVAYCGGETGVDR